MRDEHFVVFVASAILWSTAMALVALTILRSLGHIAAFSHHAEDGAPVESDRQTVRKFLDHSDVIQDFDSPVSLQTR
jgi:hypothetical protein